MSLPKEEDAVAKTKMERLNSVILTSIIRGGIYGALVSIPTSMLLTWRSPTFRWLGLRGKIFYHTILVAGGANFVTEKEILRFEKRIQWEKNQLKEQLIQASISNGDYWDYADDTEMAKVNHTGGKKKRTDVASTRLERDEIMAARGAGTAKKAISLAENADE